MRTFAELLREYTARTGVSDAELARAAGVQRQTVFRWKEGLVARPRSAEDVLHLAAKLRLTPAERDELLLAAGFPPVTPPPVAEPRPEVAAAAPTPATRAPDAIIVAAPAPGPPAAPLRPVRLRRSLAVIAGLMSLAVIAFIAAWLQQQSAYPRAAGGETLIVIAPFGNYTGGAQGYNVAGRLSEALKRELAAAGLQEARVALWPTAVTNKEGAAGALTRSGAALLLWGEYDSGRVVARSLNRNHADDAGRELSLLAATPDDLPAVINSTLPGDIRYVALHSLAQVYLDEQRPALARAALGQAGLNLPADPGTRAAHYFLWGYTNQISQPPDLDAAIEGYTEALSLNSGLDAAHNNRAVSYLRRRGPGDLEGAVADLTAYIAAHADDPVAYNNRGSAYFFLGGPDNLARALADFDRAITLAPEDSTGYYNRGLVNVRLDDGPKWRADFRSALERGNTGAAEGLCWAYSLSEEPATAIDYCGQALAASSNTGPLENLGVAYARTGQYDQAVAALGGYRDQLRATGMMPGETKDSELSEWLAALKAGKNPFDAEALRRLREE